MSELIQNLTKYAQSLGLDPTGIDKNPKKQMCLIGLMQNQAKRGEITYWFYENSISPELFFVPFSMDLYHKILSDSKHHVICGRLSVKDRYFGKSNTLSSPVRFRIVDSNDGKETAMCALGNDIVQLSEPDQYLWMGYMLNGDNYNTDRLSYEHACPNN